MRHHSRFPNKLIARIDVSALVAILTVLLFAFMTQVASFHGAHGISAEIPRVGHPRLVPHARREDAIIVTVQRTGDIIVGHERVRTPNVVHEQIRNALRGGSEPIVYIRADARSKYKNVKDVLDEVRLTGVEHVGFLVDQRKPTAAQ